VPSDPPQIPNQPGAEPAVPEANGLPVDAVEVRIPATPQHLSAVRAVAADLAMHQDMDLDSVDDLRLAVDEACSTLVQLAAHGETLACRFTVQPAEIKVNASVRSHSETGPSTRGFSWQVLQTLTDHAVSEVSRHGGAYLVCIELTKRKPEPR